MKEEKCWIEVHNVCGDCGRRYVEVFNINDKLEKTKLNMMKPYLIKYNMCCNKCSLKKFNGKKK
ncbi:MAG: hypothetical protein M0R17_06140 [Candidatus Omnitrophica bacterium]|jgi:hypothetical protein|nr:hypothetical protein [Candidatus Omnitrophota bacterium]